MAGDVREWLEGLGLGKYAEAFAENEVELRTLPHLDQDDLKELGVALGHRKLMLAAIAELSPAAPTLQSEGPERYTPSYLAERIRGDRGGLEGERKQVTILFADIKGSLEMIEGADPEHSQAILDVAVGAMMDAVHRFEGTVNKVLGDGIMAIFGAPLAHEDHAVRACFAALAMQEAIRRDTEEVRRRLGVELQIRVGINSGEVVVRAIGNDLSMDYDAIGQTTHLAGRMEQLAIPGTTRLTSDTLRLAEGFVVVRSLGPVPVKGLESPVEVFELTGATLTRTRFQAAVARGLSRFVGRQTELEALNRAQDRAGEEQGQIVAVIGEPGVGKSRLFYEFVHSHRTEGWLILESGSVSYGKATTYLPVIDLLKTYFRIEARDDHRSTREKVTGKLLTLDEGLKPMLVALLALLDVPVEDAAWKALDSPQRRQRTLDATKSLLLRESRVQPLILVFEDLHWIDSETQAFLDSLIESLPAARLLMLVNYRPEYRHAWVGKTYYSQYRIDPLPPESVEELLASLLGDDAGLGPLKQMLIARTEGNPFFLEESVRTLIEMEALTGAPGAYRVAEGVELAQTPATVQGVLAARIDRLAVEDKQLLQTSAVIGKDVPYALVQTIADLPEEALRRGLANLQAAEFLYETRLFPDLEYTFKHALTHEVAYSSLLQERRKALHRRIAEAIELIYAARLGEQFERLAHHFTEAHLAEQAVGYWQQAGQRAIERSANLEAIGHLSKGLELLGSLPDTADRAAKELTLQTALGIAWMAAKGFGALEVEQAYARAKELCQQVGDDRQLFQALWGLGRFYTVSVQLRAARELAEQILPLAERLQEPTFLVEAHLAMGVALNYMGEFSAARTHYERVAALYNPEQHRSFASQFGEDPGVLCRARRAFPLWMLGYTDQALETSREAITIAQNPFHPLSLARALAFAAVLHQFRREARAAMQQADAAIDLSTEKGFPHWLWWGVTVRAWALIEQGQVTEGIAQLQENIAGPPGGALGQTWRHASLAEACGKVGHLEEGLGILAEAAAYGNKTGEYIWQAELHRLKGELLLKTGAEQDKVEECFRDALEVALRQQAKSLELRAAMSLTRLWHAQGKRAEGRDLLAPIYDWFSEGFDTPDLIEAQALLDELG